ncbi:MAG: signal peptide peptidase SppA, partial [Kiloniellales bacterium]|nr:signal peptide peptidase SppA [Kiloniellales bacterium]
LAAAKGQVWSGEDAKDLGLVDELGGLWRAFELAREAAGLEPDAAVQIKVFPEDDDPFEAFLRDSLGADLGSATLRSLTLSLARLNRALSPLVETYEAVTGDPHDRVLMAPTLRPGG